jgi:type IV secretory pathway TrbD component
MRAPLFGPNLLFGVEQGLLGMAICISAIFVFILHGQLALIVGIATATSAFPILRRLARHDNYWSRVVTRALATQRYYPARSYANVVAPKIRKQQRIARTG